MRHIISSLAVLLLSVGMLPAQQTAPLSPAARPQTNPGTLAPVPPVSGSANGVRLQFTAAEMGEIIELYQQLTKKRVIRDPKLADVVITMETPGLLTREEAVEYMEKSLLLAGYSFVPSGGNMLKLLAVDQGKVPSTEGVPIFLRKEELPNTDQVVSYVLQLQHLDASEASQAFAQIIPLHPYGRIGAVPNSNALIITENSNTIRAYVELARQVDLPPGETTHKTIQLERADAVEVADQLTALLDLDGRTPGAAARKKPISASIPSSTPVQRPNPQQAAAQNAAQVSQTTVVQSTEASEGVQPKIQPIPRTNSLLVMARPLDIERIESLVRALDAGPTTRGMFSRRLNYIDLTTFINIAGKALLRNLPEAASGFTFGNPSSHAPSQGSRTNSPSIENGGTSSRSFGGVGAPSLSGGITGSNSGGFGTDAGQAQIDLTRRAESALIGRTLIIVDPSSSKFFASGPPEELRILNELADELDVRPRQILLSVVIGEFSLGNEFNFGLDWVRTLEKVGNDNLVGGVLNTQGTTFADISNLGGVEDFLPAMGGLTVYGQIGKNLNVFLQALESTNRFHVMQKPTVTTLNHQPASIYIGQQIAIAGQTYASGANTNDNVGIYSTTQYVPVRLQLDIVPHIFNNKEIMLEFKQQNNDISGYTTISGNQVPNISEQGMMNTLIVPDRTTAMLGGLITERDRNEKKGIPFLVRIPIVKHLFGNTSKGKDRRELMIFVQPRIMEDGSSHIQEQSEWAKRIKSYEAVKEFSEPQDNLPLNARPPSDGQRPTKENVTPLLPLPGWKNNDEPPAAPKARVKTKK